MKLIGVKNLVFEMFEGSSDDSMLFARVNSSIIYSVFNCKDDDGVEFIYAYLHTVEKVPEEEVGPANLFDDMKFLGRTKELKEAQDLCNAYHRTMVMGMLDIEAVIRFFKLTNNTRKAQKDYFKLRDKASLVKSKELESKLDEFLKWFGEANDIVKP